MLNRIDRLSNDIIPMQPRVIVHTIYQIYMLLLYSNDFLRWLAFFLRSVSYAFLLIITRISPTIASIIPHGYLLN